MRTPSARTGAFESWRVALPVALAAASSLPAHAACVDGGRVCVPGDAIHCACPGESDGIARCDAEGAAYGACACGQGATGATGATDASGANASSASGGGAGGDVGAGAAPASASTESATSVSSGGGGPPIPPEPWGPVESGPPGIVRDVQFGSDETVPIAVYVAAAEQGIHRSLDDGVTWQASSTGITNLDARTVTPSVNNPTALFMTSDRAGGAPHVFRSGDRGDAWTSIDLTVPTGQDYDLHAFRVQPDLGPVAAGFDASTSSPVVLVGASGGAAWSRFPCGEDGFASAIAGSGPTNLYVAVYAEGAPGGGVFRATDGARTWVATNEGIDDDSAGFVEGVAIDASDPDVLFAAIDGFGQIFRTTNGGASWSASATGLDPTARVHEVEVARANPLEVYAGTSKGVYRSVDGGLTWALSGLDDLDVRTLAIHPTSSEPTIVFAGVDAEPSLYRATVED